MTITEGGITIETSSGTITSIDKEITGSLKVPSYISSTKVEIIGGYACSGGKLSELDIFDTEITIIRSNAFLQCSSLVQVHLPQSLITIEYNSFAHAGIISFHIPPNVQYFDGYSVNQCPNLDILTVDPMNPYFCSINNFIFSKDMKTLIRSPIRFQLEDIPIFSSIQSLGRCPFSGCHLRRFIATSNLSTISTLGFHVCNQLGFIDLSQSTISEILGYVFYYLSSIHTIILPQTVTNIRTNAYMMIDTIKTIHIPPLVCSIESGSFNTLNSIQSIIVYSNYSFPDSSIFIDIDTSQLTVHVQAFYPSDHFGGVIVMRDIYKYAINNFIYPIICTNQYYKTFSPFLIYLLTLLPLSYA